MPFMTEIRTLKKHLRLQALARRDALADDDRVEASLRLAEMADTISVEPGEILSGFFPIKSEMDIRPLMFALAAKGARLCLPVVVDRQTIVFRELIRTAPLVDTGFGTVGPGPDAAVLEPDVMLVPLAAFDDRGHRIGYGAGHYDRYIAGLFGAKKPPRLTGIAFDCQQVDRVPDEAHDIMLPQILTESGLRRFAAGG
jgi:5-formyltetrahydrofolate cyclo-ligase